MIREAYLIRLDLEDGTYGYVHFKKNKYYIDEGKVGACGFTKENAIGFMGEPERCDIKYELELIDLTKVKLVKNNN